MTVALRCSCALSASALVGMSFPSGARARRHASGARVPLRRARPALPGVTSSGGLGPLPRVETGGLRRSIERSVIVASGPVTTLADRAHRNLCDFHRWLPGLYSGAGSSIADGMVAVTGELDLAGRTAPPSGPAEPRQRPGSTRPRRSSSPTARPRACTPASALDDDITEVLTAHGFAEMATTSGDGLRSRRSRRAPIPPGFRVRLAESADDVARVRSGRRRGVRAPRDPGRTGSRRRSRNPERLARRRNRDCDRRGRRTAQSSPARCRSSLGDEPNGYVSWVACADGGTRPRARRRRHPPGDQRGRSHRGARLLTLEASPFGRNTYAPHGLPRAVRLPAPDQGVTAPLTPAVGDFVAQIEELLDARTGPTSTAPR